MTLAPPRSSLPARSRRSSPDAIRRGKRLLNEAARGRSEESLALEEELQRELLGSPNQIAAVQAALGGESAKFDESDFGA